MLQILEGGVQTYRYLTHSPSQQQIFCKQFLVLLGKLPKYYTYFCMYCVCYHMHLTMQLFNDFQPNISSYHSFYWVIIQILWSRSLHRWWPVWNSLVIIRLYINRWLQTYRWALSGQWLMTCGYVGCVPHSTKYVLDHEQQQGAMGYKYVITWHQDTICSLGSPCQ